jgi:hypothetical protein
VQHPPVADRHQFRQSALVRGCKDLDRIPAIRWRFPVDVARARHAGAQETTGGETPGAGSKHRNVRSLADFRSSLSRLFPAGCYRHALFIRRSDHSRPTHGKAPGHRPSSEALMSDMSASEPWNMKPPCVHLRGCPVNLSSCSTPGVRERDACEFPSFKAGARSW